MKHTDAWPMWDGREALHGRRIRLDYPNGRAYAVGVAERIHRGPQPGGARWYGLEGTGIQFATTQPNRIHLAPEGER